MRVSTNQFHSQGINSIQKHQTDVLDAQLKLSTGKRVNVASDDPVATNQIHSLNRTMSTLDQYAKNGDFAKSQLALEETAVTDVINNVQRARELTLQMMNGTYNENDRTATSAEIGQIIQQISSQMNFSNSQGEKLFAGNNVNAELAYVDDVANPGYKSYIGHQNAGSDTATGALNNADNLYDERANYGSRLVQVGFDADNAVSSNGSNDSSRIRITDSGSSVFSIPDGATQFKTDLPYVETIESPTAPETAEFKFYPMTEGQAITIAGLTYTAGAQMTADEVAGAFSNLANGDTAGAATATGAYTGAISDWKSGTVANGNELVFTTTSGAPGVNVDDIVVQKQDNPSVETITSSATAAETANFKFYPMTEGQAITIAGLTYTADTQMTADDVANAFFNIADSEETGPGTATGTYTGALTGWSSDSVVNGNERVFTATAGVDVNVPDIPITKTEDHPPEANILNVLIELKRDLDNNDVSGMADYAKDMDAAVTNASSVRAEIGGRQNRIESQYAAGESYKLALEERRMGLEDMDIVQGVTDLTQSQNALDMAQQVFTRVQSMSLFDYLK